MRSEGGAWRLRQRSGWCAALLLVAASAGSAQRLETEPTLRTRDLLPVGVQMDGSGYKLSAETRLQGYLGQYHIETDLGPIEAQGSEILIVRLAELPALARIDEISRGQVFADAIAASARRTGAAVARVVTSPIETAKGIPAGIGRLLTRTARSVQRLAQNAGDAASGGPAASPTGSKVVDYAREAAGLNRARRDLAQSLGIDPYSGNPLLQTRLESLAWAAVAGGLSMDIALGAISGSASQWVSISGKLDRMVWEKSPEDIRDVLEKRLLDRGNEARGVRRFLRTPAFTPTLQIRMVEALERLGRPSGEDAILALAAQAGSELHARFLITQLAMLAQHTEVQDPIVELIALSSSVAAETRGGVRIVSLPVDFLSYTDKVEEGTETARRVPARLLVSGKVSSLAARELKRLDWDVRPELGLPPG